jgi:SSS family solute:Na+ symporter
MVHLTLLDYGIILATLLICFIPALFFGRRSGKTTTEFFASGRSVPWWLAGLSMVATTFSSDTPNLVTNIVRTQGVAGNWQWWAFVLTGVSTVFFYARLWRRSGVMTDLEFYEQRYSGDVAHFVRGFRAIYLGLFFNCFIIATVNLAGCKIANILFGIHQWQTLLFIGLLNVVFAAQTGLWGVLVIDMFQFFIKMSAVIAAAYFAVTLPQVGGLHGMVTKVSAMSGPDGLHYLDVLPDFRHNWDIAAAVFVVPLAISWWANWYPGAEPGGGSYIAQRMLASKSEKDALGSVLFFNIAHYVMRPWPWILVGLCSLIVYPDIASIQKAFPHVDKSLIADDSGYPAMLKFLPVGWMGLMIGGLIAAGSSTILTHLNWGASYLVHDFYRRFLNKTAGEQHYVTVGRIATVMLFVLGALMTYGINSAQEAFNLILQIGAGTGLLYLVRWFWWRVNAWCEITGMISSFAVSVAWFVAGKMHVNIPVYDQLLLTVASTTVCWITAAFVTAPTERAVLLDFYRRVRPAGPGWKSIREEVERTDHKIENSPDNLAMSALGWVVGCAAIWSSLFAVGNYLYGRTGPFIANLAVFAVSGSLLVWVVNKLWSTTSAVTAEDVAAASD